MSHLSVRVWAASNVAQGYIDAANEAIHNIVEPQVDFYISSPTGRHDFEYSANNWGDLVDEFETFVYDSIGTPPDMQTQLLLIDHPWYSFGAGHADGVTHNYGPFGDSESAFCGVNGALKGWVSVGGGSCALENGDAFFRNTVAHEVLHTMDCPHETGELQTTGSGYEVTPLMTWYSSNNCAANEPLDYNCNWTQDRSAVWLTTTLSQCTKNTANAHHSIYF